MNLSSVNNHCLYSHAEFPLVLTTICDIANVLYCYGRESYRNME